MIPTRTAAICAVILSVLISAPRPARAEEQGQPQFFVHWCVSSIVPLQIGNAPVESRRFVLFNYRDIGKYPPAGPHMIERAPQGREAYIQEHTALIASGIADKIPNPNWTGFAAIDWEIWMPYWSGHQDTPSNLGPEAADHDYLTDWRDHIRATRPGLLAGLNPEEQELVFRDTWLAITREFHVRTLHECQRLRPNVNWGFYHLPLSPYFAWFGGDPSFLEQLRLLRLAHEEMAPVLDASDAFFPSIYIFFQGVPANPNWNLRQVLESENREYLRANVEEAKRLAHGKPVIPFISPIYHDSEVVLRGKWTNSHDLRASFAIPRELGASGVVLWGWLPTAPECWCWQRHLNHVLFPTLRSLLTGSASISGSGTFAGAPANPSNPAPSIPGSIVTPTPIATGAVSSVTGGAIASGGGGRGRGGGGNNVASFSNAPSGPISSVDFRQTIMTSPTCWAPAMP